MKKEVRSQIVPSELSEVRCMTLTLLAFDRSPTAVKNEQCQRHTSDF